jgi:hypothetical protein
MAELRDRFGSEGAILRLPVGSVRMRDVRHKGLRGAGCCGAAAGL